MDTDERSERQEFVINQKKGLFPVLSADHTQSPDKKSIFPSASNVQSDETSTQVEKSENTIKVICFRETLDRTVPQNLSQKIIARLQTC